MRTKRTSYIVVLLLILSTFGFTIIILPKSVSATTLYVGGAGPGNFTRIQDAIDAATPGDTIFVYSGHYMGAFYVNKTLTFVGEDKNTTSVSPGGDGSAIYIVADWVNVSGFTVTWSGPFGDPGIRLHHVSNCNISYNNVFSSDTGIGLMSSSSNIIMYNNISWSRFDGLKLASSSHNLISNNTFFTNYSADIYLNSSSHNTFYNNTMHQRGIFIDGYLLEHWNTHAIDTSNILDGRPIYYWKNITGGTYPLDATQVILANCTGVTIENRHIENRSVGITLGFSSNNIIANNTLLFNSESGLYLQHSDDNFIAGNNASGRESIWSNPRNIAVLDSDRNLIAHNDMYYGYYESAIFDRSNQNTFANNTVSHTASLSVAFYNSHENNITNNSISASERGSGIQLVYSNRNNISGNEILSNDEDGILIYGSRTNALRNNLINGSGDDGIHLWYSEDCIIVGNNVTNNRYGISLSESHWNIIANNYATGSYYGIHSSESQWNRVTNNNISLNQGPGIALSSQDSNNTITYNIIYSNGDGIQLKSAFHNAIFHNNVVSNVPQAFDDTSFNEWDNGYPFGGNYWSDYSGTDQFSGPGQNVSGSDEIGDTPYLIDSDSQDRYPLMSPFTGNMSRPPVNLHAYLSGGGQTDVTVKWSMSPDDGMGFGTVVGYGVYRNSSYSPDGTGYGLIASLPSGSTEFVDSLAGEGDANDYFYRICSINVTANTSCAENQAGKFTRPLSPGMNLVSIPLIQLNDTIKATFQTVAFDNIWTHNPLVRDWESSIPSKPYFGGYGRLNISAGLWINVTWGSNLTVAGIVPSETEIHLLPGWNLVSFPSFDQNYTVADLRAAIPVLQVEGFSSSSPPHFLRSLLDADKLEVGYGYWIEVATDTNWTLP